MEKRKARRFGLRLPIELVRQGRLYAVGETRNLSSAGVLFKVDSKLRIGQGLEYFVTLFAPEGGAKMVRIHCRGRVMRVNENGEIAATLERCGFVRANNEAGSTSFSYPAAESDLVARS
jgi:hypothetical protein